MTPDQIAVLRDALAAADYTVGAVVEAIGEEAHRALGRNHTVPARRVLRGRDDPLATLTRLWPLQAEVTVAEADRALPGLVEPLAEAGVVTVAASGVTARFDIRPYAVDDDDLWVAADLTPGLDGAVGPTRPDFVLGVSPASSTLAQLAVRRPVRRALDLGAGCGVQSLHLADHAREVVATDVNPRALDLSRLTFALNDTAVDLRPGSLYEPVAGERFDLVVTNPPYVMSPPTGQRLVYREGTLVADGLVELVVRGGAEHLADDGVLQVLGNWAHIRGQDWADRLRSWVAPTGCDAHVVQREVLEPSAYVELWLADAGLLGAPDYVRRYDAWLDYFAALGIEAVGMGWVVLHRSGLSDPAVRVEDWPHPVEQPIGPAFAAEIAARGDLAGRGDADLLAARWVLSADVRQETSGRPGDADPEHLVLRQQRGFRRAIRADTALAAVLGACDGDLALIRIVAAVADLLDEPAGDLAAAVLPRVRELAIDGLLAPGSDSTGRD